MRRQLGGKAKAAAAAQKRRQDLTLALMPSLPKLLRRFQTDPIKVCPACSLPILPVMSACHVCVCVEPAASAADSGISLLAVIDRA